MNKSTATNEVINKRPVKKIEPVEVKVVDKELISCKGCQYSRLVTMYVLRGEGIAFTSSSFAGFGSKRYMVKRNTPKLTAAKIAIPCATDKQWQKEYAKQIGFATSGNLYIEGRYANLVTVDRIEAYLRKEDADDYLVQLIHAALRAIYPELKKMVAKDHIYFKNSNIRAIREQIKRIKKILLGEMK